MLDDSRLKELRRIAEGAIGDALYVSRLVINEAAVRRKRLKDADSEASTSVLNEDLPEVQRATKILREASAAIEALEGRDRKRRPDGAP